MRYIGFCGAGGSGKTTLSQEVSYEMSKISIETDDTYYDFTIESFAKPLKDFCVSVLGLTTEQVYGDDKNTLTQYTWGQMPYFEDLNVCQDTGNLTLNNPRKRESLTTAREVMQWWGTDVFRVMDPNTFIDRLKERVYCVHDTLQHDVYIDDVRFANEAEICDVLIHVVGDATSTHESEQQYKTLKPHTTIDTRQMGLDQAAKQVCEFLREKHKVVCLS